MSRYNASDVENLTRELEKMFGEGGANQDAEPCSLEPRYDCDRGFHKWKWYVGFHLERYHFCELCDAKDYTYSKS